MSTAIIGGGLAGLTAAIKIKKALPQEEVVLLEKQSPQSNTQIAGQRYRAGIAGKRSHPEEEILSLFASRNEGKITPQMELFTKLAVQELAFWQEIPGFIFHEDRNEWFGPQWGEANQAGGGRGKKVLDWYRQKAKELGIPTLEGEVQKITIEGNRVEGITISHAVEGVSRLEADNYILAGGNMAGRMYYSTNKDIRNSPQELAFDVGLSIVDATTHMIHPFGNADKEGRPRIGCFETDILAGVKVYLDGTAKFPLYDRETTELLREHQAHYYFPQIAQKFRQYGSVVLLEFPNEARKLARVSYHYGNIGIETRDGVSVVGANNLYAVGDAPGIGYWTNYRERFPGFALLKCLTDGELVSQVLQKDTEGSESKIRRYPETYTPQKTPDESIIKEINSYNLDKWLDANSEDQKRQVGEEWMDALRDNRTAETQSVLSDISLTTAFAHKEVGSKEGSEPFRLNKELLHSLSSETKQELRKESFELGLMNRRERL